MSRKPRFNLPGYPQHVVQRGNNRQACFFDESDYRRYSENLAEACEKCKCEVHAYVLMTNHVHLLVTPGTQDGVSQMMQSVGRRYVRYVNDVYGRTGTLWEGRYKASLVESDAYLLSCYRYIELNPVRAGMFESPAGYCWSSYGANACGRKDAVVRPHSQYEALGQDPENRQRAYRELLRYDINDKLMDEVRDALNQDLVLGTERFKDEIEAMLKRRARPGRPGRPRKLDGTGIC